MASKESKLGGPGRGPWLEKWEQFHGKSEPWLQGFGPKTVQPRRKLVKLRFLFFALVWVKLANKFTLSLTCLRSYCCFTWNCNSCVRLFPMKTIITSKTTCKKTNKRQYKSKSKNVSGKIMSTRLVVHFLMVTSKNCLLYKCVVFATMCFFGNVHAQQLSQEFQLQG